MSMCLMAQNVQMFGQFVKTGGGWMIDNTLAIRMAERLENITTVCKNTGISRTTLTSIYHKRCKSISNDTLETLCDYFDCDIGDLLVIKKKSTHWSGKISNECTQTQPARGYIYNTTETWFYTTSNLL